MKNRNRFITVLAAAMISILAAASPKDTLRILAIGNSFSVNAIEKNLHGIADAAGKCAIIGNLYIGGCSLETHSNNCQLDSPAYSYRKIDANGARTVTGGMSISRAVYDEKWDIVTFQQASHFSGMSQTYEPYLTSLILSVRGRLPQVRIYFHQTWAYAATSKHKAFPDYDRNQEHMYDLIMFASGKAVREHQMGIIPAGTAIQNIRGTFVGDNVNVPDGFHLNDLGCYTAACTWFEALFGKSVTGNAFRPQGITEEQVRAAQKSAHAAVRKPYKATIHENGASPLALLFKPKPARPAGTVQVKAISRPDAVILPVQRCPQRAAE